jgi:sulfate permease, SulP family
VTVAVLLVTFALTVLVDLTVAIEVGMVLAAFLFIRRMAEVTNVNAVTRELEDDPSEQVYGGEGAVSRRRVPDGVEVYEHALKDVVHRSREDGTVVLLSDVHTQPLVALTGSPVLEEIGRENVFGDIDAALRHAGSLVGAGELSS